MSTNYSHVLLHFEIGPGSAGAHGDDHSLGVGGEAAGGRGERRRFSVQLRREDG